MCPEAEIQFRVKNNLIHRLEEGKFMIKEYRRSAADTLDLDQVIYTITSYNIYNGYLAG